MKLSTETNIFFTRFGELEGMDMLKRIGYDALDYSMFTLRDGKHPMCSDDFEKKTRALRAHADSIGICFNQAHAPFPSYREGDVAYNKAIPGDLERAFIICGILGVEDVVVHPITTAVDQKQINMDFYASIEKYSAQYGFKIALENMFGVENGENVPGACGLSAQFADYVDSLDPRHFTACLDLGHSGIAGEDAADAIRTLGHDRLTALHVHDNDKKRDLHTLPYQQLLNWPEITKALHDISYSGTLTFEADAFLWHMSDDLLMDAGRFMHTVGRKLIRDIENS